MPEEMDDTVEWRREREREEEKFVLMARHLDDDNDDDSIAALVSVNKYNVCSLT